MSRGTKKAGITGKYGCRYGSTLRKTIKAIEESQHKKYICVACGKKAVKRKAVGIWKCKRCPHAFAGAAYAPSSASGRTYGALIKSLKQNKN
ncbi:60S ribosomal protein [Ecytonucleospora hepatopenaei]|uniref:60S ribosomal protein n=1 Tax=Ecytonucleospora hepatopenaei TaxID=646526 RepID=A0A1W0E4Y8_9MICR|nr:60S ribosomal protein [Ecytonucleospora hepatopenaei]